AGARVRVRSVDEAQASAAAEEARYRVGPGRIEVLDLAGELVVSLPRGLAGARIDVDGRTVVVLRDGVPRLAPAADSLRAQIPIEVEG
ncbi:MAG: hypothetical protein ACRELC_05330, partial [Gemmatimonadota bacterium]